MGCCKTLIWSLVKLGIVCLLITFIPGIPPHASYKEVSVKRPRSLDADLANNRHLDGAQRLFEGEVFGPEAFAVFGGSVYTGVHGGFVMRVDKDALTPIVKFGKQCGDIMEEQVCGRPLGLKFDKYGNLYVADAYYGIFKYNLKKGETTLLVSSNEEIEGKKSIFVNGVTVGSDGTVYFTVPSTTFPLYDGVHSLLAPGDGRLMRYDPRSGKSSVLADGLLFPNGIEISPNDDYLVVVDTIGLRVMKYNLKGSKKDTMEVFIESLPGAPDNIRSDGGDGFYVSLIMPADESHPFLPQVLSGFPNIRRFLGRVLYLLELPFIQINKLYPNYFCQKSAHLIGHFSTTKSLAPPEVTVLRLDSQGNIQEALIGKDGSVSHVSDIVVFENDILLGSPYNDYIGRVPNPYAPPRVHIKSVRYEEATPGKQTKKETPKENSEAAKKLAEEAKIRKDRDEAARKAAEEVKAKKAVEAAALRAAEEAKIKKAAEEAAKKAEEEAKAKKAVEAAAKKAEEEARAKEAALKAAEEARTRKAAEEAAKRKEEARARKVAEEARAKKKAEEEARRAAEQAKLRKEAEEAQARKVAEEANKKRLSEEAERRMAAEEAAARKTSDKSKSSP